MLTGMKNAQKMGETEGKGDGGGAGISLVIPDEAFCGITPGSLMYFSYI